MCGLREEVLASDILGNLLQERRLYVSPALTNTIYISSYLKTSFFKGRYPSPIFSHIKHGEDRYCGSCDTVYHI